MAHDQEQLQNDANVREIKLRHETLKLLMSESANTIDSNRDAVHKIYSSLKSDSYFSEEGLALNESHIQTFGYMKTIRGGLELLESVAQAT